MFEDIFFWLKYKKQNTQLFSHQGILQTGCVLPLSSAPCSGIATSYSKPSMGGWGSLPFFFPAHFLCSGPLTHLLAVCLLCSSAPSPHLALALPCQSVLRNAGTNSLILVVELEAESSTWRFYKPGGGNDCFLSLGWLLSVLEKLIKDIRKLLLCGFFPFNYRPSGVVLLWRELDRAAAILPGDAFLVLARWRAATSAVGFWWLHEHPATWD